MTRRRPPPLPPGRRQHAAVDHVAKFVADELIVEPKAFLRLGALGRVYFEWCEMRGVMNRRLSPSLLLLRLADDFGFTCGNVYTSGPEGQALALYALRGARLRDPALNARIRGAHALPAKSWQPVIEGVVPDVAQRIGGDELIDIEEDE